MSYHRSSLVEKQKHDHYDLLVIGGGITGAGIALDAAARGMKVALVEKGDFASGTSSKSTKLIHGGLRYLKQFEIGLVWHVGRERALVHQLAPHLVVPEKMLLPITKGGTFGKTATAIGLKVYDFLAGVKGKDRRRMLSIDQVRKEEPMIRSNELLGGGIYAEYRTDDARLTIEIIKTAIRKGATCSNYVAVKNFNYHKGKIAGAQCVDVLSGAAFNLTADCVVSAAGPWVDQLRERDNSLKGKRLFLSKGVHIVVAHERLPLKNSIYFDVPGGRMLFAIPRQRATYIGTTDTPYDGDSDHVFANREDVEYLLAGANGMFPSAHLSERDVESTWAGLRPLIFEEGKPAGEMSRKDEIFVSASGLISIAGGKLTGYRRMAERVVDMVAKKFQQEKSKTFKPCQTRNIPLAVMPFRNHQEAVEYQHFIKEKIKQLGLPPHYPAYLVENYGKEALTIADHAVVKEHQTDSELAILKCELEYCLEQELVMKPADFFERRTGRLYFNYPSIEPYLNDLLAIFQKKHGWDQKTTTAEKDAFLLLMKASKNFEI
ncbi:MAG: glycerol-3-phosphate dehydrogenase/oxidase [Saprospiraceae bacterium]